MINRFKNKLSKPNLSPCINLPLSIALNEYIINKSVKI